MQAGSMMAGKQISIAQQSFITKVYMWMFLALLTTAGISYYIVSTPDMLHAILKNPLIFFGLIIAEFALVIILSAAINKLSATVATACFFVYSALTGITLSAVFITYTTTSLFTAFLITAGTFGTMSLYGLATKKDLTSIGNLCLMGLMGIIISSLVNIFFKSTFIYTITNYAGVLIFVGLTAYDTQKIKKMGYVFADGTEEGQKASIMGALQLYLDFINLFLIILRLFGRRR